MYSCTVIGMGDSPRPGLPREVLLEIASCRVFSGGRRHHGLVRDLLPPGAEWVDVAPPIDAMLKRYEGVDRLVVFASGDPLFHGIAATIVNRFPECAMRVFPAFNSLQALAHRLCLPYHDMRAVSLVGRPWNALDEALVRDDVLIGILADRRKSPHAIRSRLLEYGYGNYELFVGERLGGEAERVGPYDPEREYAHPCCLIARRTEPRPRPFGIPDDELFTLPGRAGMVTKMPCRLLALSALGLGESRTLWDIGFCTGSVSIEARLRFPHLDITAFEKRPGAERLLMENARKFGTPGIRAVMGDFLEADISGLAPPDAVFVGGHGGMLPRIMERVHPLLGGSMVFNSVTPGSAAAFMETAARLGMRAGTFHVVRVDGHNPITILKATK